VALRPQRIALDNGAVVGSPALPASTDSLIASIVARVNPDTVRCSSSSLQDFKTRHANAANRDTVAEWIKAQFERMGYATAGRDSFYIGSVPAYKCNRNPARARDLRRDHRLRRSSRFQFRFRHDQRPRGGRQRQRTAAASKRQRVLKEAGYTPKVAVKFATFAAEEIGLRGSAVDAARSVQAGTRIRLMINHDMIANNRARIHRQPGARLLLYRKRIVARAGEAGDQSSSRRSSALTAAANSGGSDSLFVLVARLFQRSTSSKTSSARSTTPPRHHREHQHRLLCRGDSGRAPATLLRAAVMRPKSRALESR